MRPCSRYRFLSSLFLLQRRRGRVAGDILRCYKRIIDASAPTRRRTGRPPPRISRGAPCGRRPEAFLRLHGAPGRPDSRKRQGNKDLEPHRRKSHACCRCVLEAKLFRRSPVGAPCANLFVPGTCPVKSCTICRQRQPRKGSAQGIRPGYRSPRHCRSGRKRQECLIDRRAGDRRGANNRRRTVHRITMLQVF